MKNINNKIDLDIQLELNELLYLHHHTQLTFELNKQLAIRIDAFIGLRLVWQLDTKVSSQLWSQLKNSI